MKWYKVVKDEYNSFVLVEVYNEDLVGAHNFSVASLVEECPEDWELVHESDKWYIVDGRKLICANELFGKSQEPVHTMSYIGVGEAVAGVMYDVKKVLPDESFKEVMACCGGNPITTNGWDSKAEAFYIVGYPEYYNDHLSHWSPLP